MSPKPKSVKKAVARKKSAPSKKSALPKKIEPKKTALATKKVVLKKTSVKKRVATKKRVVKKKAAPLQVSPRERYEMIATMAYYRAEKRNFEPGHDDQDWLECETIVDQMLSK